MKSCHISVRVGYAVGIKSVRESAPKLLQSLALCCNKVHRQYIVEASQLEDCNFPVILGEHETMSLCCTACPKLCEVWVRLCQVQ